jgi:hypothetical protein
MWDTDILSVQHAANNLFTTCFVVEEKSKVKKSTGAAFCGNVENFFGFWREKGLERERAN